MQTILFHMRWQTHLDTMVSRWLTDWREAMTRLALANRAHFSQEEVAALFTSNEFPPNALDTALSQGWLFSRTEKSMRPTYVIPDDVREAIRKQLRDNFMCKLSTREDEPLIQQEEAFALISDLTTFIDYIQHHDVPLTTEGAMYKRNTQQLMELFEVPEDLTVPEWRFGYGRRAHDYPDRFALLYDFAYDAELIREQADQTLQITDQAQDWRALAKPRQLQRMLRFYLRLYRRPIPRLREIVEVMRQIGDKWVEKASVLEACGNMVTAFYYDTREDVFAKRILKMLTHLGVIRTGFDEESGPVWFQMTNLGQELLTQDEMSLVEESVPSQASLIVQPNFEVMVTLHNAEVEGILAQFADLKSSGAIRIYRILEHTVTRGLHSGYDFQAWRELLTKQSLGPIPGNVERTLNEWMAVYMSSQRPMSS
jgi:hypothetical protein